MAEFYVEKNASENGVHLVHSSKCTALPAVEDMHYMGAYSRPPVTEALDRYIRVSTCPNCLPA